MIEVNLREFANTPFDKVLSWRGSRKAAKVTDDFGETALSDTSVLMLTHIGLIINRHYPKIKYSVKQLVPSNKVGDKPNVVYNDNTLSIPINYALKLVMPSIDNPVENDRIKQHVYHWQIMLNNLLTVMSEESMISARAEDIADLMDDPGIVEIVGKVRSGEVSIDDGEELFEDYIKTAKSLDNNTMALLTRTGGVSVNQGYQTVCVRGAVFDLNNTILPNPIMSNYAEGIGNLADNLGDSRSSGKALLSNGRGLQDSEFFHRKLNIFASPIQGIEHTVDCGSRSYLPMVITCKEMTRSVLGSFYYDEEKDIEKLVTSETVKTFKTGDVLLLRNIAFCNLNKDGHVCGKCFGKLKAHIPYNVMTQMDANVGLYSSTTICNPIGQKMLSTKHFIRNAITKAFEVHYKDVDILSTNGDEIFIKKDMIQSNTKMIFKSSIVKDLSDYRSLDTLDEVTLDKLPGFDEVTLEYEVEDIMIGGTTTQRHACRTSISSRRARFSLGFLEYLMARELEVQDRKFVIVDLSEWNHEEPMFSLPYTREDLDQHRARVENFLTFNKRNKAWRDQVVTPKVFAETLSEFWTLINTETKGINMKYLEVVLAAALTKDPANGSYKLALGGGEKYFSSFLACMANRGIGQLMIFQGQQKYLSTPSSFLVRDRQASPLESFFANAVS